MTKTDIILILLFADGEAPIVGTTRLQKLLFLVEHEKNIKAQDESFAFEAFKFGPVSRALYDDLEFLINIGLLEKTGEDLNISNYSLEGIEGIDAKDLLDDESEANGREEDLEKTYEKREEDLEKDLEKTYKKRTEKTAGGDLVVYRITDKGIDYLRENNLVRADETIEIENIKKRYGKKSLVELLKYIYIKYPKYTTESVIKDELL